MCHEHTLDSVVLYMCQWGRGNFVTPSQCESEGVPPLAPFWGEAQARSQEVPGYQRGRFLLAPFGKICLVLRGRFLLAPFPIKWLLSLPIKQPDGTFWHSFTVCLGVCAKNGWFPFGTSSLTPLTYVASSPSLCYM